MTKEMSLEDHAEFLKRAIRHVTAHIQTEIGTRAEFYEIGCESTGEFNPEELEDDHREEISQLLFSCHVIQANLGPCPSPEFPGLVAKLKAHVLPNLPSISHDP